jgi:DNA-binding transcriptional LysR family regulator
MIMLGIQSQIHTAAFNSESKLEQVANPSAKINIATDLLRTFISICELGSFTKTARLYGLTQPAVSAQVKRLEYVIGADLIERNASGIKLTNRGYEVLKFARRMLSINDQILAFSGSETATPVIRIGVPNVFASEVLHMLTNDYGFQSANVRLQICCDNSPSLMQLDNAEALSSWPEKFVWVRAPSVKFAGSEIVPLISSPNRVLPDRIAIEALARANRKCEIVFWAYDRIARYAATLAGFGYLTMLRRLVPPTLTVEEENNLSMLPSITAGIIAREGLGPDELSPLLTALEDTLRQTPQVSATH